jgi:succinate-acetate transporter protein
VHHHVAHDGDGHVEAALDMRDRTRIILRPIAAPSILGLFGFAGATFMVAAWMAGWYGDLRTPQYLFPFCAAFGGLAQFTAAMWAFTARDALATAMHGMWGAFWLGFGTLFLLAAVGALTIPPTVFPAFAYWFIVLAVITLLGAIASLGESLGLFSVLAPLGVGSAFAAIYFYTGIHGWEVAAGWVLLVASWTATYTAAAMMLSETFGRTILPLGRFRRAANIPGGRLTRPIGYEQGMPGVRVGQ